MTDPFRGSIHKELVDGKKSLSVKYGELVVGRKGLFALLKYEIITGLFSGFPGALGFFFRKIFFPCLLGETGRGVVFGRGITLRHPHKIRIGARTVIDDQVVLDAKGESNGEIPQHDRDSCAHTAQQGILTRISFKLIFIHHEFIKSNPDNQANRNQLYIEHYQKRKKFLLFQ